MAPLIVASLVAALVYRIASELLDGIAGLLAALLLVSVPTFRWLSLRVMSPMPVMLMGMLMIYAYLCWRRSTGRRQLAWALLIGIFAGWGAVCRPLDALCYALPVGLLMVIDVARHMHARRFAVSAMLIILGAAPFFALQLLVNKGITGSVWLTPYRLYHDRDAPASGYGFTPFDPSAKPESVLPQKQLYYSGNIAPTVKAHRPERMWNNWVEERLPLTARVTTPHLLLLALLPLGVFAIARKTKLWALGGIALILPLLFAPFTFFLPHYAVPAAPGVAMVIVAASHLLPGTFPRAKRYWQTVLPLSIAALALTSWKTFNRLAFDDPMSGGSIATLNQTLDTIHDEKALVLFRFDEKRLIDAEPVYNADVAWPDEAQIIRAHDLSAELTSKIIAYYAQRSPERIVYRYDEGTGVLARLGSAGELARGPASPSTWSSTTRR
jgi:4-amino-4-deoxy-L-arabinose transferase-like glycosyltransferase